MKSSQVEKKPGSADYRRLYDVIAALEDRDECKSFFSDLCTPAELEAMADRWRAVRLLKAGKTYREIADLTGMSVTTIGRVARYVSMGNGGYESAFNKSS